MYGQNCRPSGPQFPFSTGWWGEQWQHLFPSLSTLELLPEVHILLMCRQLSLRVTPPTLLFLTAPVCPLEIRPLNKRGISREWSFICWRGRGCSEEGFVSHSSVDASKLRAFTGVGRTSRWSPPPPHLQSHHWAVCEECRPTYKTAFSLGPQVGTLAASA